MPLTLFFRLMQKGDDVAERAIGKGTWGKIKSQWESDTEDDKGEVLLEAKKNLFLATIKVNKFTILVHWLKTTKKDPRPVYEEIGLKWHDDPKERAKQLDKLLSKESQKASIYKAKLDQLKESIDDDDEDEGEFSMTKLYEAIASLELHGHSIPDYNKLSIGKYIGITRVIKEKIKKEKLNG